MSAESNDKAAPPSRGFMPAITIGTIAGIDNIGSGLAIASLLFAGPLVQGLDLGVGVVLLGCAVLALVVALRSTLPNSIALVQETSIAILAVAIAAMAVRLDAPVEAKIATALAILGVSTIATGALFVVVGLLRLGGLVRFLPFPVVAGFLAGTGWLLIEGALLMLTGEQNAAAAIGQLAAGDLIWLALPAVIFAAVMTIALRRLTHPFTAPAVLITAGAVFYAVLYALGLGVEEARGLGHLPQISEGARFSLPTPDLLPLIDWQEVAFAIPSILSAAALSLVALLLNTGGLELETGRDIDADSELRSTGIANLISGSFGGPAGFTGLAMTALGHRLGARDRRAGIATAIFMVVGLLYAKPLIAHMPIFLTAGFILFLGIELIEKWAIASRPQLPLVEWLIVIAILAVVAFVGFMEALAVGLMVSITLFVYNYSRLPVVRLATSGTEQRSSVDRSPAAMKFLAAHGDVIEVVQLQGYLFFGTADRMVNHVRRRLARDDAEPLRYLILDFRHVSGVDSAASVCFGRIRNLAETNSVIVFFSHMSADVRLALEKSGLSFSENGALRVEADVDHALERCEESLLSEHADGSAESGLLKHFTAVLGAHPRLAELIGAMTEHKMEAGETLIEAGEDAGDVYFVGDGRVRIQIALADGRTLRLRTMTSGAVVGEIALYLGQKRTADVIVEKPSTIYSLSAETLARLETEDSQLAVLAHRLMASNLSEKLAIANRLIQVSQR